MCDPGTVIVLLICTALACAVAIAATIRMERRDKEADEIVTDVEKTRQGCSE